MKRLHIIGSSISLDNNIPLKGEMTRSIFTKDERVRQTYNTIFSILTLYPEDTICLIDSSLEDVDDLLTQSIYIQSKVQRYYLKQIDPQIANIVSTHPNKSYGESLMFKTFLTKFSESISQFDYIIKHTGRYFTDYSFDLSMFNEENFDKVFFKPFVKWPHHEKAPMGPYHLLIPGQENWEVISTPTVIYGWGKNQTQTIIQMYDFVLSQTEDTYFDGEHLLQYFFHNNNITPYNVHWAVNGWGGQNGNFYRY